MNLSFLENISKMDAYLSTSILAEGSNSLIFLKQKLIIGSIFENSYPSIFLLSNVPSNDAASSLLTRTSKEVLLTDFLLKNRGASTLYPFILIFSLRRMDSKALFIFLDKDLLMLAEATCSS